jgi:hypothetical protein
MSRTTRKIGYYQWQSIHEEVVYCTRGYFAYRTAKEPTKKDIAVARSDGGNWNAYLAKKSHHWYWNQVSRKRRRVEQEQAHKFYKTTEYNDVDFDDSEAEKKRKGILWEIY